MKDATVVWAQLFLILIISAKPLGLKAESVQCKHLGNNSCLSDVECCSGHCYREPGWELGVCKKTSFADSSEEEPEEVYEKGSCKFYKGHRITANGHIYDEFEMTAAHRTLPFNTRVKVEVMGSSAVVKINDRKTNADGQILLMSYAAAERLDIVDKDSVPCQITIMRNVGCTPDFGKTCVYNHECCSENCFRDIYSEAGFCEPQL